MTNAIRAIKAIEEFGKLYNWPDELVYYLKLRAGHGLFNYGVNSYMEYDKVGYLKEIMDEIADSLVLGVIWADLRDGEAPLKELSTLLPMCMEKVFDAWQGAKKEDIDRLNSMLDKMEKSLDLIDTSQPATVKFQQPLGGRCPRHGIYTGYNCSQCLNFPE